MSTSRGKRAVPSPSVAVELTSVGGLTLVHRANGAHGMLPMGLTAVPHGFSPTRYTWKVDEGSAEEQSAEGGKVNFDISLGAKETLHYDHEFRVVASEGSGRTASARYAIHLTRPSGYLVIRYDDPRSQVGAVVSKGFGTGAFRRVAHKTVLVETSLEGLLGRVVYVWTPVPENGPQESPDLEQAVFRMVMNGDPDDIESYEGVFVKVQAIDEIGQSVLLEKFVDPVATIEEPGTATGSQ